MKLCNYIVLFIEHNFTSKGRMESLLRMMATTHPNWSSDGQMESEKNCAIEYQNAIASKIVNVLSPRW